jgi:glutamate-ammonia-ligase adenylyltransferase
VDARLRPDGKKGSLVVTDARLAEYYEREAQAWERLALVKARFICGDEAFGRRVETIARDAVFGRALTAEDVSNVEDVRKKIVESATRSDLKKDEGGIAELEFGLRLLQIAHATRAPELRRGDVQGALGALEQAGAVGAETAGELRAAYVLFRRIENRLRLAHGRATSTIPAEPSEREQIARQIGLQGDLLEHVEAQKRRVHAFYQAVVHSLGV